MDEVERGRSSTATSRLSLLQRLNSGDGFQLRHTVLDEVIGIGNDVNELERALQETSKEEAELKSRIQQVLQDASESHRVEDEFQRSRQDDLEKAIGGLKVSIPTLQMVYKGAAKLDGRITETREMADVVSKRVREIDLARSRALLALKKVKRVMELRDCLKGVKESMHVGDLEAASDHIFRYRQSGTQEEQDQVMDVDDDGDGTANREFQECEESLSHAVLDELNLAIERRDDEKVLKACRIFAKLGQAREGLSRLLQYRCEHLRNDVMMEVELATMDEESTSRDYEYGQEQHAHQDDMVDPNSGAMKKKSFLDLLVYLLNQGAAMIQRTQQVVRVNIGDSPELQGQVIHSIHAECDRLIVHILGLFMDRRRIEERVRMVIQNPEKLGEAMSLGASSWLEADTAHTEAIFALDTLLDDIALMLKHTETYQSFIEGRKQEARMQGELKMECLGTVQELAGYYTILEEIYMSTAIHTALDKEVILDHISSSRDLSGGEEESKSMSGGKTMKSKQVAVSSVAEDAFYVIDKCRDRAMATRHTDSICAVVNNIVKVLEDKLGGLLQKRVGLIKDETQFLSVQGQEQFDRLRGLAQTQAQALSALSVTGSSAASSNSPASKSKKNPMQDLLKSAEVTLNSLSLCILYTEKLRAELEQYAESLQNEKLRTKLKNCVDGLLETIEVFQRYLSNGLDRLMGAVKPKLRDQMDSTVGHQTTTFELAEEEYLSQNETNDPYVRNLLQLADVLVNDVSLKLDLDNSAQICQRTAAFLAKGVEYAVVRKQFTPFGAILFDKQLRSITNFFEGRFPDARMKFRRLRMIADLLNLDHVEDVHDVFGTSSSSMTTNPALSSKEVKRVLALRVDFKTEDIKRLKI